MLDRQRAKDLITDLMDNGVDVTDYDIHRIVDEIYDDFKETRVCKNCKYLKTTYAPICDLGVVSQGLFENGIVTVDFGCNKFEKKENV